MAKKENKESNGSSGAGSPTVLARCLVDKCGKKIERLDFCEEHYLWFKEGLINKQGEKPRDFDKKYQNYIRRNKPAA